MKRLDFFRFGLLQLSAILFVGLFLVLYLCVPYLLKGLESDNLFLRTSDYIEEVRSASVPAFHFVRDYLLQFFYYKAVGPFLIALGVTLVYLMVCVVFRPRWIRLLLVFAAIGVSLFWVLRPSVRQAERWAQLEYAAQQHQWNKVLSIVTPDRVIHDRGMIPYAFLALAMCNELPQQMLLYPLNGPEDFDSQGEADQHYFFFKMVLYDALRCPNEAIHCNFQAAKDLPHGTSFGTLRRLVRYNRDAGNPVLVNKYETILSRSTLHRAWRHESVMYPDTLRPNLSGRIPVLTHTFGHNLGMIIAMGNYSVETCNYMLCWFLASRNLSGFTTLLNQSASLMPTPLPRIFQEALVLWAEQDSSFDINTYNVSVEVLESYKQFCTTHSFPSGSYWRYFFLGQGR